MFRLQASVLESVSLPGAHHRLVLRAPALAAAARPGQFIHVWCHSARELVGPPPASILRRPFSISRLRPPHDLEILLRLRGTGGRLLASRPAGDSLDLLGPLGNGFSFPDSCRTALIIAGGIGIAPVPFLIDHLRTTGRRVVLLAGAPQDTSLPYPVARPASRPATIPDLQSLGAEVTFVSETGDGLLVSDLLSSLLTEFSPHDTQALAIGPRAMLKRIAEITDGRLPLQVTLEERMACGLGACRSCVVPTRGPHGLAYQTVCRDGPVFDASHIAWEQLTT